MQLVYDVAVWFLYRVSPLNCVVINESFHHKLNCGKTGLQTKVQYTYFRPVCGVSLAKLMSGIRDFVCFNLGYLLLNLMHVLNERVLDFSQSIKLFLRKRAPILQLRKLVVRANPFLRCYR
jgi:hypothetical protein